MDAFLVFALVLVAFFLLFGAFIILVAAKSTFVPTKHQVDEALGIVELPPIRISNTLYEELVKESNSRGLVVQAIVREAITEKLLVDKSSGGDTL